MVDRTEFICSLIGKPWEAGAKGPDAFDCWHLCRYVRGVLFHDELPEILVPKDPKWPWILDQFRNNPEFENWQERRFNSSGVIKAQDGSIVLMARNKQPAHAGLWMAREQRILHCDQEFGVMFQDPLSVKVDGWAKLRFYERA